MKINSTEVAKKAGVSRSTVSRVINNNPSVVESTRNKVLKVIQELNYTPNTNAQSLAGKKSSVIGLFIFEDTYSPSYNSSCLEFFMNFVSSVGEEVFRHKHQLLIDVIYNQASQVRLRSLFQNGNISSGIFIGAAMHDEFIQEFIKSNNKVALIDYSDDKSIINEYISLVNTDDISAAEEITNELIDVGSKHILHITGNTKKFTANQRIKGYKKAIKHSNLTLSPDLIAQGDFTEESGYRAIIKCLERRVYFDSIFAANDLMARGAQLAMSDNNMPEVPIWGYDNLQGSLPLGIMSADPCLEQSAIKAVDNLIGSGAKKDKIHYTKARLVKSMNDYLRCFSCSRNANP